MVDDPNPNMPFHPSPPFLSHPVTVTSTRNYTS